MKITSAAPASAPVQLMDANDVDAPDASAAPEAVDDFVSATPTPKPQPMPVTDDFEAPTPAPAAAPTLADLADSAPKALQETVLKQAGLDDDTLANMSDAQIADAFKQVVEESGKPGRHSVTIHFDKAESYDAGGDSGGTVTTHTDTTQKMSFTAKAIGDVNGMKLDPAAVAATEKTVHLLDSSTVYDTLNAMGFNNYNALDEQGCRDLLATAMVAARTPGAHDVSVHTWVSVSDGGDGGGSHTELQTSSVHFDSDKKGVITVDGKQLPTAQYIAMSQMLESVPTDEQRAELVGAGFPQDKVSTITPEEVHRALTHVSLELARPGGVKSFEVALGGDDFNVTPKLDDQGKLLSLDIAEKPKKKSWWKKLTDGLKKIAGPVLTVLSFIPVTAPFAIAANAALSVVNGIKNHNPLGIIAGIAGGVAGFAGNLASDIGEAAANGLASTAQTVANVANTASAGLAAIQGKNPGSILGFIAGAAGNLAGFVGDGAQDLSNTLRDVAGTAGTAAQVANGIDAIRNHDLGGIVNAASGALGINRPSNGSDEPVTARQPAVGTTDDGYVPFENNDPVDDASGVVDDSTHRAGDASDPTHDFTSDETTQPSITPVGNVSGGSSEYEDTLVTVKKGDTLSALAQKYLGDAKLASVLYAYNKDIIGDDGNLLQIGDELAIPPPTFKISPDENNEFWDQTALPGASSDEPVVLGTDDQGNEVTVSAEEHAATKKDVEDFIEDPAKEVGIEVMSRVVKALDYLGPLGHDLAKEGAFADALLKGDPTALGKALADNDFAQKLIKTMGIASAEDLERLHVLTGAASLAAKGLAGFEGYENAAADTTTGKAFTAVGAMAAEFMAEKLSVATKTPAVAIIDGVIQAAGQLSDDPHTREAIESLGIGKNFSGAYEAGITLLDAVVGPDSDKGDVLTRWTEKARAGKAGIVLQGYTAIGEQLSGGVNWLRDQYEASQAAAAQQRQRDALRRRVQNIQSAG